MVSGFKHVKLNQADIYEMYNLYRIDKNPLKYLSNIYGVTEATIRNWFNKYGIETRSLSEASELYNKRVKLERSSHEPNKITSDSGYIMIWTPTTEKYQRCYVYEHRLVWESNYGPIPNNYVIHHLNGIKTDNRIENLDCISKKRHDTFSLIKMYQKRILTLESQLQEKNDRGNG